MDKLLYDTALRIYCASMASAERSASAEHAISAARHFMEVFEKKTEKKKEVKIKETHE